jgi:hypothetical protein
MKKKRGEQGSQRIEFHFHPPPPKLRPHKPLQPFEGEMQHPMSVQARVKCITHFYKCLQPLESFLRSY